MFQRLYPSTFKLRMRDALCYRWSTRCNLKEALAMATLELDEFAPAMAAKSVRRFAF